MLLALIVSALRPPKISVLLGTQIPAKLTLKKQTLLFVGSALESLWKANANCSFPCVLILKSLGSFWVLQREGLLSGPVMCNTQQPHRMGFGSSLVRQSGRILLGLSRRAWAQWFPLALKRW